MAAGAAGHYDRQLGLDTAELFAFIGATQNDAWVKLQAYHGNDVTATQQHFTQYLAKQIDERGPLDVLRRGVKDKGITFRLAYFKPAHAITADALTLYRANRLTVTRQLAYSEHNSSTLDLVLFVNGIPLATAELKNPLTGQTVEDAKRQYRQDRDPKELLFARRTLVHFAVDPDLVFVTTRLARDKTRHVFADQGFAGRLVDWTRDTLRTTLEIVRKPADQRGFAVHPRRWVVERTLAWLTVCRRLARDYERHPAVSEALIRWAAIAGMTRRISRGYPARRQARRTFTWT